MTIARKILSAALLVGMAAPCLPAQETDVTATRNKVYQQGVEQDQLRIQADRLRQELTALLEEYRQSGGSPADTALLQQAIGRLGNVGEKDMAAVVQTLRDAGALKDGGAVQTRLVSASEGQRNIQTSLRTLTDLLAQRQNREALQKRLQELVARQTTNLRRVRDLAEAAPGAQPVRTQAREVQVGARLMAYEQGGIQNEAAQLAAALDKATAPSAPTAPGSKDPNAAALAATRKLADELRVADKGATATTDAKSPDFAKAAESQQALLTSLQTMSAKMSGGQPASERLRQSAAKLQDLARQQQELTDATRSAKANEAADLRERQRQLADQMAAVRAEIAAVDARAANGLDAGEQSLRAVDGLMKTPDAFQNNRGKANNPGEAAKLAEAQAEVKRQLEAASDKLSAQANASQGKTPPPGAADAAKAVAALQQLQQQVNQALTQQQALATQPASPDAAVRQKQLAAAVENMQRQTQSLDANAAGTLGQASDQMQQAANSQTPQAQAQAAASLLAQAQEQLQKDVQAASNAAAAQQAAQALQGLIAGIKAQAVAAGRTMTQTATGDLTPAVQQMEAAGAAFPQVLALVARGTGGPFPKEVAENLAAARTDLASSGLQAAQAQRKPALALNQRAQTELDAAIAAVQSTSAQQLAQALPESAQAQSQNQAADQSQPQPGQSSDQSQPGDQSAQNQPQPGSQSSQSQPTGPAQSSSSSAQTASNQTAAGQPPGANNQSATGQPPAGSQSQAASTAGTGPNQPSAQNQQNGPQTGSQSKGNSSSGPQAGGSQPAPGQTQTAQGGSQPGQNQPGSSGGGDRSLKDGTTATGYTVVNSSTTAKQREAVALFQNEKVPSEYSEMVQQYSKNLAEGRVPEK